MLDELYEVYLYALYYDHCISVCFDILHIEKVADINWIELN